MSQRAFVLAEQIRQVLSYALSFEMRDPELHGITVTRVKLSPDLQFVDVRFFYYDEAKTPQTVLAALNRAKGAFKRLIAGKVAMRRVPELRFHFDEDMASEQKIEEILKNLEIPEQEQDES